ncbi:MAG: LysM peptidoglycan-binding domain-containing protein [Victivallaceae bacterium]|nr:LysM peptidoglycan-binding domain-containing protein [Victivallaceae bacterium]
MVIRMTHLMALTAICALTGCAPQLAQRNLGSDEERWEQQIQRSYSGWVSPRRVPPTAEATESDKTATEVVEVTEAPVESTAPAAENPSAVPPVAATGDKTSALEPAADKSAAPAPAAKAETGAETASGIGDEPVLDKSGKDYVEHVVRANDSLSTIAKKYYHDGRKFPRILDANKEKLPNPNRLIPGMTLKIPMP